MRLFITAAKQRAKRWTMLLYPAGLAKPAWHIIANEMGVGIRTTSGPAIERQGDLVAILTNLQPNDVLFIDEIHRLNRTVEEVLYPAMEEGVVDIIIGKGPGARSIRLELPPFTLVGATTRAGMLTGPLRDRFGVINRLEFYSKDELTVIVRRSARILGVEIDDKGAEEIAGRARGIQSREPFAAPSGLSQVKAATHHQGKWRWLCSTSTNTYSIISTPVEHDCHSV